MGMLTIILMGLSLLAGVVMGFTIAIQVTEVVEEDDNNDRDDSGVL